MVNEHERNESSITGLLWSAGAEARLVNVPEFVRKMVKGSIEQYAAQHGYTEVNEQVLDRARESLGV